MRQIKTRIHCKNTGKILAYEVFNSILNSGYYWVDASEDPETRLCNTENYFRPPTPFGGLTRVEFTGLKDINGVEIYEGDILQDQYGKAAIVSWFRSSVGFELLDIEEAEMNGLDDKEPAYIIDDSKGWVALKIIGNIYQNPELLP